MSDIYIDFPTHYMGSEKNSVENAEQAGLLFTPAEQLKQAGFSSHWRSREHETAYDLAKGLSRRIDTKIKQGGLAGLSQVDGIVYTNCFPNNACAVDLDSFKESGDIKSFLDYPASHLQADFNMDKAFVVGLTQQACTGMLGAIRTANA
jgi:3-oxoacyl-[acyl-carrier-protein] synthase-3